MTAPLVVGVDGAHDEVGRLQLLLDFDGPDATERAKRAALTELVRGSPVLVLVIERRDGSALLASSRLLHHETFVAAAGVYGADLTHARIAARERGYATLRITTRPGETPRLVYLGGVAADDDDPNALAVMGTLLSLVGNVSLSAYRQAPREAR